MAECFFLVILWKWMAPGSISADGTHLRQRYWQYYQIKWKQCAA